jgi:hypothetical protein
MFLIKFLRKFGKVSEDSLWSRVSQGQYPFERSMLGGGGGGSLENEFEVFKLVFRVYFLGTKSQFFIQRNLQIA